jgi:gamma-glutamylcyclotransferase (GGCT)/AIG2-like uncharacterized protein YtfP
MKHLINLQEAPLRPIYVFVYGTLMKGNGNHDRFLLNSTFIGNGSTSGELYDVAGGGFPILVYTANPTPLVYGEVYEVTSSTLKKLDMLEGHPEWYQRVEKQIRMKDRSKLVAYAYTQFRSRIKPGLLGKRIDSGSWKQVTLPWKENNV